MTKPGASVAVGFMSRKLTVGQRDRWDTRDKETYAVVSALERWAGQIGYNKVLVLTDHKSLESWHKEHVAGMGPTGRRSRWHAKLNKFRLEVIHIPGASNIVGDALSRWAYPASSGYDDNSWHGTPEDTEAMTDALREERAREQATPRAMHPMDNGHSTSACLEAKTPTDTSSPEMDKAVTSMCGETQCSESKMPTADGTSTTMITMPHGKQLALPLVSSGPSREMNQVIAAVTRSGK